MFTILAIVTIAAVARPMAEAYAEKLKTRYKAIGSDEAQALKVKVDALENEVLELKSQVKSVQESTDFAVKLIEGGDPETLKRISRKQP
jgi:hypothetical protein